VRPLTVAPNPLTASGFILPIFICPDADTGPAKTQAVAIAAAKAPNFVRLKRFASSPQKQSAIVAGKHLPIARQRGFEVELRLYGALRIGLRLKATLCYSGLMPAARTMPPHFSNSRLCMAPSSSGVLLTGSAP
jgi:hypothetical protein